jgi:hypothetical protein
MGNVILGTSYCLENQLTDGSEVMTPRTDRALLCRSILDFSRTELF